MLVSAGVPLFSPPAFFVAWWTFFLRDAQSSLWDFQGVMRNPGSDALVSVPSFPRPACSLHGGPFLRDAQSSLWGF